MAPPETKKQQPHNSRRLASRLTPWTEGFQGVVSKGVWFQSEEDERPRGTLVRSPVTIGPFFNLS